MKKRVNWGCHEELEAAMNEQINIELNISYGALNLGSQSAACGVAAPPRHLC